MLAHGLSIRINKNVVTLFETLSIIPDNDPLLGLSAVKAVKVPAALKG